MVLMQQQQLLPGLWQHNTLCRRAVSCYTVHRHARLGAADALWLMRMHCCVLRTHSCYIRRDPISWAHLAKSSRQVGQLCGCQLKPPGHILQANTRLNHTCVPVQVHPEGLCLAAGTIQPKQTQPVTDRESLPVTHGNACQDWSHTQRHTATSAKLFHSRCYTAAGSCTVSTKHVQSPT